MKDAALKLAFKALTNAIAVRNGEGGTMLVHPLEENALTAIKEALAQPEQEPVAWMHVQGNYKEPSFRELADDEVERGWEQYPLYNTPPQRTWWVGLTDEEREIIAKDYSLDGLGYKSPFKEIEAKLKEKNECA